MKSDTKKFSWGDVPKAIWYFMEEDKGKFIFYFFLLSGIYLYDLVPPYLLGKIIDFFTSYRLGQSLSPFYWYVGIITISWILASQIRMAAKLAIGTVGQNARTRARVWGFERLTEFSLEWHNKENTGNKLQRIFTGAEGISTWLKLLRKDLIKIFVGSFGIIIFFLSVDIKFFILVFLHTIIFFCIEFLFDRKIFALSNEFNRLNQKAGGTYIESATNMLSIKALGSEGGVLKRVANREDLSRKISIEKITTNIKKWRFLNFLNGITLGIFIYLLGSSVISGAITIGMVLIFYNYFDRFSRFLAEFSDLFIER